MYIVKLSPCNESFSDSDLVSGINSISAISTAQMFDGSKIDRKRNSHTTLLLSTISNDCTMPVNSFRRVLQRTQSTPTELWYRVGRSRLNEPWN